MHESLMKKVFTLLFVAGMMTFAACQSKPKAEETTSTAGDSTMATTSTDSAMADSAAATVDSAAATADSVKN